MTREQRRPRAARDRQGSAAALAAWTWDDCRAAADARRARDEAHAKAARKVARALDAVPMPGRPADWLVTCPHCGQETVIFEQKKSFGPVGAMARSYKNCPSTAKIEQLVLRELRASRAD
jgi:hypothetical protein